MEWSQAAAKAFRGFLAEASGFYHGLLRKMEADFGLSLDLPAGDGALAGGGGRPELLSCHRSLVFLGDLARYREQHREGGRRDWAAAANYYHQAVRLLPDFGNPHNQLAVLATYVDDDCSALYRYCRALCLLQPFGTAADNMKLLFQKNREKLAAMGVNVKPKSRGAQQETVLRRFCTRFVRLHGMLTARGGALEGFEALQDAVGQDITFLGNGGVLTQELTLMLVLINIYSVYAAARCAPGLESGTLEVVMCASTQFSFFRSFPTQAPA